MYIYIYIPEKKLMIKLSIKTCISKNCCSVALEV